ncbi:MAG: hypothetical protein CMG66_02025 [Candidatus Marinimicrobia bacterium]|nr:hypothetical protein [Candidatus Neomarinimicrobiota bacterium]
MNRFDPNNYEFNPDSKIGIYLIHGFSSTTYELKVLADLLNQKGYHVVLKNLPGHGTNVDDCNKYSYNDWLDCSKIELAKLFSTSDQVFIIGCSMGAVISLYLASIFPVSGIIIGGTVLKFKLTFSTNYLNTVLCHFLRKRAKKLAFPKEIRDTINFYGYKEYPLIALNQFRKMNNVVLKKLKDVKSPILIIHSENDRVSIKENVKIVHSMVSSTNKKILEVKHAHHNIFDTNQDTPIINKKILNFIKQCKELL